MLLSTIFSSLLSLVSAGRWEDGYRRIEHPSLVEVPYHVQFYTEPWFGSHGVTPKRSKRDTLHASERILEMIEEEAMRLSKQAKIKMYTNFYNTGLANMYALNRMFDDVKHRMDAIIRPKRQSRSCDMNGPINNPHLSSRTLFGVPDGYSMIWKKCENEQQQIVKHALETLLDSYLHKVDNQ